MSKTAYVFIFVVIGLALVLHALDEKSDREVIGHAASIAIYDSVGNACEHRNSLRNAIWGVSSSLHAEARSDEIRRDLNYEDCDVLSRKQVKSFQRRLENKTASEALLKELTLMP